MKRILCALLAALMLLSVCACGTSNENNTDTSADSKATNAEDETREPLEIPDTKYDNVELTFLTRDAGEWSTIDIYAENSFSDNISEAVYTRNEIIRDRYGVLIKEIKTTGTATAVQKEVSGATGDFQGIVASLNDTTSIVSQGYLVDLNTEECEYLDFDKSWWDHKIGEELTIDGHLYFGTGDLLTADNDGTFAIMFNKKIVADSQIPDMYALVANGGWTMDKMFEYEQLVINDKNGDSKLTYDEDICGFAYTGDTLYCMMYAGGITLLDKDEDENFVYCLDVERASDVADKVRLILKKDIAVNMNDAGGAIVEVGQKCFGENHCLFFGECLQCVTRVRGYDVDFGILPYPKFDEKQQNYCALMEWVGSVVSIPRTVTDKLPMVTSMIEAMAYHAVPTLTEQYYEINLKTRDAKDEQSGPMIDLILANRVYDLAYAFQWASVGNLAGAMGPNSNANVASTSKSFKKALEKQVKDLIKAINKNMNK